MTQFLVLALSALFASSGWAGVSFPRTAHLLVQEGEQPSTVDAYFAVEKNGIAYYWAQITPLNSSAYSSSSNNFLSLAPGAAGVEVTIQQPYTLSFWQATLDRSTTQTALAGVAVKGISKTMPGSGADNLSDERRDRELTGVDVLYGYNWDLSRGVSTGKALTMTLLSSLERSPEGQAHDRTTVSSPARFLSCDGCEHADQLFVENGGTRVNIATLDFGKYGDFDCEGTRHAWLDQLIALGVPFAFEGELTVLTGDLWEGGYWTAVRAGSRLGLGKDTKTLPLLSFLDSIQQADPRMEGAFVSYRDELLTYRQEDAEMIFDLNSTQKITRRR